KPLDAEHPRPGWRSLRVFAAATLGCTDEWTDRGYRPSTLAEPRLGPCQPTSTVKDGILMLESAQSSVITKFSSRSVAETVDRLKRFIADRGFTLFRVIESQRHSRRSWCADARFETRHVWEPDEGRGGDARGTARGVGSSAQGPGLGGRERSGIGELQLTGIHGRAAPHRRCPASALRRS